MHLFSHLLLAPLFALSLAQQVRYSPDGTCGSGSTGDGGFVCTGTVYGDCCSFYGNCGNSTLHCSGGCQLDYGLCTIAGNLTPDGTCGGENEFSCQEGFGGCCSSSGFCGTGARYCGAGCQSEFSLDGACMTENLPSTDGSCGGEEGLHCTGGEFDGQCCSQYGFCGTSIDHCSPARGCQPEFGRCN